MDEWLWVCWSPPLHEYGAVLFVSMFLATNARMVVAVATQAGMYGAMLFVSRFLATNARMVVGMLVATLARICGYAFCVYVFSHECTNGCGSGCSHPGRNVCGYAFCVYVFSHECTNGCGCVGSPETKTFVHSCLSSPRLNVLVPIYPQKHTIRAFVAKLPAA
jgi:hypothetical protein